VWHGGSSVHPTLRAPEKEGFLCAIIAHVRRPNEQELRDAWALSMETGLFVTWHDTCIWSGKTALHRLTMCCCRREREKHNKQKIMKLNKVLLVAGFAAILAMGTSNVFAQDGGPGGGGPGGPGGMRFDPAQMRKMMTDRYREQLGVKDDAEWTAISTKITAVQTAQRANMGGRGGRGRGRGMGAGGPGGGGPGGGGPGGAGAAASTPLTDAIAALQKAYDDKAPAADVKTAIAKVASERKALQTAYNKAQDDLRGLLNARQEAYLTLNGLLQ